MLSHLDTLHTIAEVGIAITGFAGIVAAVRGRAEIATRRSAGDPLRLLLGTSLGTVFFCFVPEWLHAAVASPDLAWRLSLGLYGSYRLVYLALLVREPSEMVAQRSLRAAGVLIGVLHVIAAVGFLARYHYFLYLTGLLWGLAIALLSFFTLLTGAAGRSPARE